MGELKKLPETFRWAEQQDVTSLALFLFAENKQTPLVCIGSGGSFSACHYAAQLYQQCNGILAQAMTPLQLMYAGGILLGIANCSSSVPAARTRI